MAVEEYVHKTSNLKYSIEAVLLKNGKWGCVIYPDAGEAVVITEPHATKKHGPLVLHDSDDAAIKYGKDYIDQDLMWD